MSDPVVAGLFDYRKISGCFFSYNKIFFDRKHCMQVALVLLSVEVVSQQL